MAAPTRSTKPARGGASEVPSKRHQDLHERPDTAEHPSVWLTIGKLAKRSQISADTIRFYEDERLLLPARKTDAGYRLYGADASRRLNFIRHAQRCGMTLAEIRQLLELKADDRACCNDVRGLAIRKKLQLEQKIKTMKAMSQALDQLIAVCTAGERPLDDCPILAALESSLEVPGRDSR